VVEWGATLISWSIAQFDTVEGFATQAPEGLTGNLFLHIYLLPITLKFARGWVIAFPRSCISTLDLSLTGWFARSTTDTHCLNLSRNGMWCITLLKPVPICSHGTWYILGPTQW
jgi:hypothetical protein